ncbi:hypothetical protein HMN09_00235000 [Mycena chlorophos]|uniref:Transmembrane protein n=1 Tax=Mycena chlorophos TaxID=658473 RepID=A0A8H6TK29_MYCCL|nr:hypothetical protein HMN09_00235000 [Mycena chlorophos]
MESTIRTMNAMRWDNRIDRCANVSALSLYLWDYCELFSTSRRAVNRMGSFDVPGRGPLLLGMQSASGATALRSTFKGTRWSLVKILFFINRYFTFALTVFSVFFDVYPNPSSQQCLAWAKFEVFTTLFCAFLVEVVMQIRLYAMYGHDRRVIFCVSMLCLGEIMSMVSLSLAKFDPTLSGRAQVVGPGNKVYMLPFCNNVIPDHFFAYWIAFMLFDMLILLMVVRKAYNHYKMLPDKTWRDASRTLMGVLARDSVFYFACNAVTFLGTTLLWRFGSPTLATIANSWSIVVPSTSAGRLMLNMRKGHKPASDMISTAGLSGLGSLHILAPSAPRRSRTRDASTTTEDTYYEDGDSYFFEDEGENEY